MLAPHQMTQCCLLGSSKMTSTFQTWLGMKQGHRALSNHLPCDRLQELTSSSHSISSFFTATDWEYHQSATRYFRNLLNIRESTVYKRILAPCLTVTAFAAGVALYNSTHSLPSKQRSTSSVLSHSRLNNPGSSLSGFCLMNMLASILGQFCSALDSFWYPTLAWS